jgi:hypothetical protein
MAGSTELPVYTLAEEIAEYRSFCSSVLRLNSF